MKMEATVAVNAGSILYIFGLSALTDSIGYTEFTCFQAPGKGQPLPNKVKTRQGADKVFLN